MRKVNIHEAKTTLSQLIEVVESGEDVLIARAGRPAARLTSAHPVRKGVKLGTFKGMFKKISKDFDEPLPASILTGFLNNSVEP